MSISSTESEWLSGLIEYAEGDMKLTPWERDFLTDQAKRYEEHGDNINVSAKQWSVLKKIGDKVKYFGFEDI